MRFLENLVKKYLKHFAYFYSHLGYRVFIALSLSIAVGLLDGLGLAMFLPMLEMVDGQQEATPEGLGNLSFIVDAMSFIGLQMDLMSILSVMLFFFILKGIAKFFESYYKILVNNYFVNRLRIYVIDLLTKFNYKRFVTTDAGRIQNTLSGEINLVSGAYMAYFSMLQAGIMLGVYVFLAYLSNPQFALLVTVGGILSNFAFKVIYKRTIALSRSVTNERHDYQGLLIQKVAFFKYLKATGILSDFGERLKTSVKLIEKTNLKIGLYNSFLLSIREPIVVLVVVAVIMVQVTYFGQSLSLIILSLLFFYRALNFVMNVQTQWNKFLNVSGSLENMVEFQEELIDGEEKDGEQSINSVDHGIFVSNIDFKYGETTILENLSIEILSNQTVAFVGESGSGKTTLVNLLAGLMDVDNGYIKIDGADLKSLKRSSYQKRIGYITQEPVIFNESIFNNVTLWAERTPEALSHFWTAMRKASIEEYILQLPHKEEEMLGNNGINLSGGQKQRISIARELYKDIDILIMDEATSALDSETEKNIQSNIEALKGDYTLLIVAHRLSTIKSADIVVLMDKGGILAKGTYQELINRSERFKNMVTLQEL